MSIKLFEDREDDAEVDEDGGRGDGGDERNERNERLNDPMENRRGRWTDMLCDAQAQYGEYSELDECPMWGMWEKEGGE